MTSIPARVIGGCLLVAGIATAGVLVSPGATVTFLESVVGNSVQFGLVVAGLYLVRPLFAWPTTPLALVVGYGFGVRVGIPVALVGILVTITPVFLATRWFVADESGVSFDDLPFGRSLDRVGTAVRRYYRTTGELRGVIVSRLAPIPSDVATCAAAASGVRLRTFLLGTGIGELPWTIAAVVVGSSAATVRTDGLGELGVVVTITCLLAAIALLSGPAYRTITAPSRASESGSPDP